MCWVGIKQTYIQKIIFTSEKYHNTSAAWVTVVWLFERGQFFLPRNMIMIGSPSILFSGKQFRSLRSSKFWRPAKDSHKALESHFYHWVVCKPESLFVEFPQCNFSWIGPTVPSSTTDCAFYYYPLRNNYFFSSAFYFFPTKWQQEVPLVPVFELLLVL